MKNPQSFPRIALLALALGAFSVTAAFAQTTPTTPAATTPAPATKAKHGAEASLTPAELAQLEKDRAAVLAANPDLKTEADALKAQHKSLKGQGPDAKTAFRAQMKEHEQKMEVAMLKLDPSVAPVLAKLKAAHKEKKNAPANA